MDMKEEKVKKLKEQFKKLYLDTVKHANDIEKWINSGKRKQGDIRRSIERLNSKYQSLLEIKKELINQNSNDYNFLNRVEDELEFNKFEHELSQKTEMNMSQINEKIQNLYKSAKIQLPKRNNKQSEGYNNIELVTDIPGNEKGLYYIKKRKGFLSRRNEHHRRKIFNIKESIIDKYYDIKYRLKHRKKAKTSQNKNDEALSEYELYCIEMQKGYFRRRIDEIVRRFSYTRKNKKEKNNKYKKVGRVSALLMAGTLAIFGGTTVGESNRDSIKDVNNEKTYVDTNKGENDFKKSLTVQALEETTTKNKVEETNIPSTVQETTIKTNKPKETWSTQATFTQTTTKPTELKKENNISKNQSIEKQDKMQNQKNDSITKNRETADSVYVLKANTKYTENSLGEGASGYVLKDTKVNIYNRALVKTDEQGNRCILNLTKAGQTWEDFAKEQGLDYKEFKAYIDNNRSIQEMVSLDDIDGNQLGWVSKDKLKGVEEKER